MDIDYNNTIFESSDVICHSIKTEMDDDQLDVVSNKSTGGDMNNYIVIEEDSEQQALSDKEMNIEIEGANMENTCSYDKAHQQVQESVGSSHVIQGENLLTQFYINYK